MNRLLDIAAVLALLLTAACGELEPPDELPGCDGAAWCQEYEACYVRQPGLALTQTDLSMDLGIQGGVHIDLRAQVTGHDPEEGMWIELWHGGERLDRSQVWFYPGEDCASSTRWMPSWAAEERIYDTDGDGFELVFTVPTWAGEIQRRIPVRIDG